MVYSIRQVSSPEEMEQCMKIRKEVFIDEQGYDLRIETNDDDAKCSHFLLLIEDTSAGTVRVVDTTGQLGRLALRKEYRGQKLAQPLCAAVHEYIKSLGGTEVWCQSQAGDTTRGGVDATNFYRRMGYVDKGERYIKEGTVHQDMVLHLK